MSYCQLGEKPKITWIFGDGKKGEFISSVAPIDIEVIQVSTNENGETYEPKGYTLRNLDGSVWHIVKKHRVENISPGVRRVYFWGCGDNNFSNSETDSTGFTIDKTVGCPPPYPPTDCQLQVMFQGNIIFTQKGKCPCNFQVACNGRCPANQHEVSIPEYPGYCCIDCASLAGEVRSIRNMVKSL